MEATKVRLSEPSTTLADFIDSHRKLAGTDLVGYLPLTAAEKQAAWEWTCKFGPGNCWTGTTGAAAMLIRRLLVEVELPK